MKHLRSKLVKPQLITSVSTRVVTLTDAVRLKDHLALAVSSLTSAKHPPAFSFITFNIFIHRPLAPPKCQVIFVFFFFLPFVCSQ